MIISHQNKFVFIKTRKTAGTSIEIALTEYCGPKDVVWMLSPKDDLIRQNLGFGTSRNCEAPFISYKLRDWTRLFINRRRKRLPFRRHVRAEPIKKYLGDEIWNDYFKFCIERNPFDRAISLYYWKTRSREARPTLNEFIQSRSQQSLSNWSKYTINDQIVVDFVGRYERLNEDLAEIAKRLKLPNLTLPNAKGESRASREHYSHVLTPETRAHIEKMCAHEIDYFGYHWIDS